MLNFLILDLPCCSNFPQDVNRDSDTVKAFLDEHEMDRYQFDGCQVSTKDKGGTTFCVSSGHLHQILWLTPCFPSSSARAIASIVRHEAKI